MATIKDQVMKMISGLPNNVDINEIMYRLYVLGSIEQAEREIESGHVISHEKLKKQSKKW